MGYLQIDNRESGGRLEEYDTKACKHCGGVVRVFKPPYAHQCQSECKRFGCSHEQYYCWRCDGMLCTYCGRRSSGECQIWKQQMEKALARAHSQSMWNRL